jgi:hypothetical protein
MPSTENLIALVAPAAIGGTELEAFHTGLWLSKHSGHLWIGLLVEGQAADRPKRPRILVVDANDQPIVNLWGGGGSGINGVHEWVEHTKISAEDIPRLAGARLIVEYPDFGIEYNAEVQYRN